MKIPKYRLILATIIFTAVAAAGYAQVNQNELEQDLPQVVFINYEGPHARIDTREEIRQLGAVLGQQIADSEGELAPTLEAMTAERRREYSYKFEAGSSNRYFVIHSVSGAEDNKIDSDIFGLGVDTGVDHIRNLRRIIQGYLQTAYGYSEDDAWLLAEYITIYNAVYRGNWDYFTERYKTQVMQNLSREKAGLSIRYDEWPGRTLVLIPLGHGGLSSVDTSTISDDRVVEELRKEDDRGVEQRRDMVDLKEREVVQAEQRAQTEREAIREEERINAQERAAIAQEREQAKDDPDRQEELDRREQALDEREETLEQRREDAQRLEEFAEKKSDEAQQDRREIARDQQTAIDEETSGGVIGVIIGTADPDMGRLVRVSPANGRELKRSPLDTVHVRTVTSISGKILAIAGENKGNGAVRLIEINQNNLEMAKQGDDDILTGSLLWVNGNDLYAITTNLNDNSCYIGRFNTDLVLQAKSAVKVHTNASVLVQQGRLLTQREDGSVLMLDPANLTVAP